MFLTAQHVLTSLQACSCNGSPCQVNGSCQQCTQPLEGQETHGIIKHHNMYSSSEKLRWRWEKGGGNHQMCETKM